MVYAIARGLRGCIQVARLQKDVYNVALRRGRVGLGKAALTANRTFFSSANDDGSPTHYTLPSGDKIPSAGIAVGNSKKDNVARAVESAIKVGHRHIDGAWVTGNETMIEEGIKASGIPREDLWLTSKLANSLHEPNDVEPALDESLARLGTDYLDLYLIQWPVAFKRDGSGVDHALTENTYPTWQKLEEMVEKGKVRNIGLCNFSVRRIENLLANPLKIKPAVNQVEMNYWLPQPELLKWCKENGILVEAYSPIGSSEWSNGVAKTRKVGGVKKIANKLQMTPEQLYLSWLVQRGAVVLTRCTPISKLEENLRITKLQDDLFLEMETLATSHEPKRARDPSKYWGVDIWG